MIPLALASPELHIAGVLMATVPMLSIYPLLGYRFGLEKLCSAAFFGATLLSFFSLTVVLTLLKS